MGAGKRVWQLLKAVALIFSLTVAGLTVMFAYDSVNILTARSFETGSITSYNATHYQYPITTNINHTGFIYGFNVYLDLRLYVNITVDEAVNQSSYINVAGSDTILPGEQLSILLILIFEKSIWDDSSSIILGIETNITGIILDYSIMSMSFTTYRQIK
jgi:hypothetical protein